MPSAIEGSDVLLMQLGDADIGGSGGGEDRERRGQARHSERGAGSGDPGGVVATAERADREPDRGGDSRRAGPSVEPSRLGVATCRVRADGGGADAGEPGCGGGVSQQAEACREFHGAGGGLGGAGDAFAGRRRSAGRRCTRRSRPRARMSSRSGPGAGDGICGGGPGDDQGGAIPSLPHKAEVDGRWSCSTRGVCHEQDDRPWRCMALPGGYRESRRVRTLVRDDAR